MVLGMKVQIDYSFEIENGKNYFKKIYNINNNYFLANIDIDI